MVKTGTKAARGASPAGSGQIYTLDVWITDGPMSEAFCAANEEVSRRIELRADSTLDELHEAIFAAFDRDDPHMYEFQLDGEDGGERVYMMPEMLEKGGDPDCTGTTSETTLESLGLKIDEIFSYWFDFGDDWWHGIQLMAVGEAGAGVSYPRVTARTGESPPQYLDDEDDALEDSEEEEVA